MSRGLRVKSPDAIFHVSANSISEFDLFPEDDDKNHFLDILKECKEKYQCKIYGYCLMTTHYHIILKLSPSIFPR